MTSRGAMRLALSLALVAATPEVSRAAGEAYYEDHPAPESAEDLEAPFDAPPQTEPERKFPFERPRDWLGARLPEDARLQVQFRSFYLRRKNQDNTRSEAWTYGGSARFDSGWFRKRAGVGVGLYTSQPIDGRSDREGTRLLRSRQRQYTVFGESYLKLRLLEHQELRLYRQQYDLPYVNGRDNRMTPNTFEGYTLTGRLYRPDGSPRVSYFAGWISKIKERDSDRFVPMGTQATGRDVKRGLATAGLLISPDEDLSFGAVNYTVPDVLNIFYAMADDTWRPTNELQVRASLQFTDQRSVGDDRLTGSSFDTRLVTGSLALSYRRAVLTLAFSTTSSEARIRSPFGSRPSPLSLMVEDFDRADEDAWLVGFSHHLGRLIGVDGLSAFANYARGNGARDETTGRSLRDQDELDLTLDYRPEEGPLRNFWLRVRGAFVRERGSGAESSNQLRIIVNYDLPVL